MPKEKIIIQIEDEDILELLPAYLGSRCKDVCVLREALATGDFASVCVIGHKMKGSGGGYGLERISEIGANLESSAKAQDAPAIMREIALLEDYLERLEIAG